MHKFEVELEEAVWRLDEHYTELKSAARQRQGSLYNPGDYPESLGGLFQVSWNFPSIDRVPSALLSSEDSSFFAALGHP